MVQFGCWGSRSVAGSIADPHLLQRSTAVRDCDPQLHQLPDSGPTHGHGLRNFIGGESACPNPHADANLDTDYWLFVGRFRWRNL